MACWTPGWYAHSEPEDLLDTILDAPKPYQGLLLLDSWPANHAQPGSDRQYAQQLSSLASPPALTVGLLLQGVSNKLSTCQTCGQKLADCTGHFGTHTFLLALEHA